MSKVTRIAHGATIGTPIPDTKARRCGDDWLGTPGRCVFKRGMMTPVVYMVKPIHLVGLTPQKKTKWWLSIVCHGDQKTSPNTQCILYLYLHLGCIYHILPLKTTKNVVVNIKYMVWYGIVYLHENPLNYRNVGRYTMHCASGIGILPIPYRIRGSCLYISTIDILYEWLLVMVCHLGKFFFCESG